jgi:hypothetical protein
VWEASATLPTDGVICGHDAVLEQYDSAHPCGEGQRTAPMQP